jgi:predicted amidophosphoribosyltransferase
LRVVDALARRDGRSPQAFLRGEERRRLSAAEFSLRCDVSQKRILLVDDVMTTGATVRAITKNLRNASEVIVITLCRTL